MYIAIVYTYYMFIRVGKYYRNISEFNVLCLQYIIIYYKCIMYTILNCIYILKTR